MSRPLRIEYPGAWYHVMNRGRRKESIFYDARDYELFSKVIEQTCRLFGMKIHAYVLMPNHYHLLIHTPLGNLSRCMRHLNGVYTQKINKKYKLDGSLFRGRFKSILISKEEYLLELVRYIHRNPYESKLEEKIGEYKWCSYRRYMEDIYRPKWLEVSEVLSRFSKYEKEAKRELRTFIIKEVPGRLKRRLNGENWPSVLGGEEFEKKIKEIVKGKKIDTKEITGSTLYIEHDAIKVREEEVKKLIESNEEVLKKSWSKKYALERRALVYLLRKHGKTLNQIGKLMGGISYVAVSRQSKKAEEDILEKKGCYTVMKKLSKLEELRV